MDLDGLLEQQGGVVRHDQLVKAGLSGRQLRPGQRRLVRVRRGAYADAAQLAAADVSGRTRVQVAAARLLSDVDLVAVGATAALVHGLPLLGPPPAKLQLAERKPDRPRHHGASTTLAADEVELVGAVPVTTLSRTAVDVARTRGVAAGVVAADAALARRVPRSALHAVLDGRARWPGVAAARAALALADGRAESALESLGRVRFAEQGLPPPEPQVVLADADGPFARVDHAWLAHSTIAEADGALKYASAAEVFAEKRREDRLRDLGWEAVRYTWDEALQRPELLAARVRQAFTRAARRRGL